MNLTVGTTNYFRLSKRKKLPLRVEIADVTVANSQGAAYRHPLERSRDHAQDQIHLDLENEDAGVEDQVAESEQEPTQVQQVLLAVIAQVLPQIHAGVNVAERETRKHEPDHRDADFFVLGIPGIVLVQQED